MHERELVQWNKRDHALECFLYSVASNSMFLSMMCFLSETLFEEIIRVPFTLSVDSA